MPLLRNAFRYRLADRPSLDTGLFLNLYCPALLNRIVPEDLSVPKLVVFSGSPGSGKSSFLRLFQTESLLAIHSHRLESTDDVVAEALRELGVFDESGIRFIGLYIQCDSNLRLLSKATQYASDQKLLNTLLDVRIILAYFRGIRQLAEAGLLTFDPDQVVLNPLPSEETAPPLFTSPRTFAELESICASLEVDFAALLNSFPGDPIPTSLVPHSRVFSLSYIAHQLGGPATGWPVPLLLLDDFQDLYEEQREHLQRELLRRVAVPRWIAMRKYVYELERLLPLEGTKDGRDIREIDLDDSKQAAFRKFLENVTERRVRLTDSLQQMLTIQSFKDRLKPATEEVSWSKVANRVNEVVGRLRSLSGTEALDVPAQEEVSIQTLHELEKHLILAERKAGRSQRYILPELEPPEPSDAKTEEAARLFMCMRYNLPYYCGFDALSVTSNKNVEQFLDIAGNYAEKMIFRAELSRTSDLSAREQEDLLRVSAKRYYNRIEQGFPHGYTIRQFIDNLARFFSSVTNRPNAPISPGVTGFALTREQLRDARIVDGANSGIKVFREALTSAVAGNIFSIRKTKQGQAGSEKFVLYFNRLLCVHFNLPLGYGGWQRLPVETIVKMMTSAFSSDDLGKRWQPQPVEPEEGE
jgi:hypothetical protein